MRKIQLLTIILASFTAEVFAQTELGSCTEVVFEPPTYTINKSGVYCLGGPIKAESDARPAIEIKASNVVLDLNGHKIGNLGAGKDNTASGIFAAGRRNLTIRNGIIRGFGTAVRIVQPSSGAENSTGHLIERLTIERSRVRAIDLSASASTVRDNRIYRTGSASETVSSVPRAGIAVAGDNNSVIDNGVFETFEPDDNLGGVGILVQASENAFVSGNRVANSGTIVPKTIGVQVFTSSGIVTDNSIAGVAVGIDYSAGAGIFRGNVIDGVLLGSSGGTDGGDNVVRLIP